MVDYTVAWWLWAIVGILLLVCEVITPGGFFIVFFGAGALAVGILKLTGMSMPLTSEILLFVGLSVVSLMAFRKPLQRKFRQLAPDIPVDTIHGEAAVALEDIAAGATGKVELRGAAWNARNVGETALAKSSACRVEKVDGLTLFVRGQ